MTGTLLERLEDSTVVRFVALGVANTALNLALVWFFVRSGWGYGFAHVVAHLTVVSIAFVPSRSWVFRSDVRRVDGFLKFHLSYVVQLVVALAVLAFAIEVLHLSIVPGELLAVVVAAAASFVLQQTVVFSAR